MLWRGWFWILLSAPLLGVPLIAWYLGDPAVMRWMLLANLALPLTMGINSWRLLGSLRSKGYDWVRWSDAMRLHWHGRAVFNLPPREEVAALPGYEDSTEGVLRVLGIMQSPKEKPMRISRFEERG